MKKIRILLWLISAAIVGTLQSCFFLDTNYSGYKIMKEKYHSCVFFKNITIDTSFCMNMVYGIKIGFDVDTRSKETLNSFGKECNGYELNISLKDKNNKIIPSFNNKIDTLQTTTSSFTQVIKTLNTRCEFFIPYCYINLPKGMQDLMINIETFPVEVTNDTLITSNISKIKRLKDRPDIEMLIKQAINQPALFLTRIYIKSFDTDTKKYDASNMDFHIFGPGLPDLFWTLMLNGKVIYDSPIETNHISYDSAYVSDAFYISDMDKINFMIQDYDEFSRNDLMANADASPLKLSHNVEKPSVMTFGIIKNLKIASVIKE